MKKSKKKKNRIKRRKRIKRKKRIKRTRKIQKRRKIIKKKNKRKKKKKIHKRKVTRVIKVKKTKRDNSIQFVTTNPRISKPRVRGSNPPGRAKKTLVLNSHFRCCIKDSRNIYFYVPLILV